MTPKIKPFLWFDNTAEEAMNFYLSIFPNSKELNVSRFGEGGPAPAGTVIVAHFSLDGQEVLALNGGPHFKLNEAFSFTIDCKDQAEVDHYWDKLSEGGEKSQCGWLKDKFGLSWQVIPEALGRLMGDPDSAKAGRVMQAMMQMSKIIVADLEAAYNE